MIAFVATVTGCAPYARVPVEPGVDFAAHVVRGGLLVDKMRDESPLAIARRPGWPRLHGEPSLVIRRNGTAGEGIWLRGPGDAIVRASVRHDAPVVGHIEPSWSHGAIHLRIEPAGKPTLSTDAFVRTTSGLGPPVLTRKIERDDELSGAYRANLHTSDGHIVGWLQVSNDDELAFSVVYESVLPPEIDEALAVASAAALGKEVEWIRDHTLDSFPGMVDRP